MKVPPATMEKTTEEFAGIKNQNKRNKIMYGIKTTRDDHEKLSVLLSEKTLESR